MINYSRSRLRVRGGPFDGCGITLVGAITTMGRDSTNDIVEEHPLVSRKHARIFYNAQGYWIQDVGSQNGTFVNGEGIGQRLHSLKNGEGIQLGSSTTATVWEFSEVQEAGPIVEAPPTLQLPVGPAASTQPRAIRGQLGLPGGTQAQESISPCAAFTRNANGYWTCKSFVAFDTRGQQIEVSRGTTFVPGSEFLGFDLAKWLDENCG